MSLNVYGRKYSHPRRVSPTSTTVKRYVYDEAQKKVVEIPLSKPLTRRQDAPIK